MIPIEHRGLSMFLDVQIDASKEIRACNYLPEVCVEGSEEDVATVETRALCGADGVSGIVPIRLLKTSRGQQWWQCLNGATDAQRGESASAVKQTHRRKQTRRVRMALSSFAAPPKKNFFFWGGGKGKAGWVSRNFLFWWHGLRFEASFGCMLEPENVTQCTKTGQGLLGTSNHVPGVVEKHGRSSFLGLRIYVNIHSVFSMHCICACIWYMFPWMLVI